MDEFGDLKMQFSFHVDNGELDKFTEPYCFVLGYELAELIAYAKKGESSAGMMFHSDNIDRLRLILNELEIPHRIEVHDDWPILFVGLLALARPDDPIES